jgi:CO/xanthine dehydrogenase Mo-binding subunit
VRAAAAEARQALLGLASANLGVPVAQLAVDKGVVSGGGKSVKYGDLVGDRLINVKITGKEPVKKPSDYKIVGQRPPRIDIPDKVTGTYTYVQNVRVPGMLHGRIVRPRGQGAYGTGAKPLSVNEASIKHIPGARVIRRGDFVGVVAPHEYGAIQAAAELKVKWQQDPILPGNGDLFGQMRSQKTHDSVPVATGNLPAGFAKAAKVVSASFTHDYQSHASMGPVCAIADVKPGSATVLCSSQNIYGVRGKLAKALGMKEQQIRVQYFEGSGCYGHNCQDDVTEAAGIMAQAAGKPVRVQFMRWDAHGWDNYGPAQATSVRAGVDANGKIVAYDWSAHMIQYFSTESSDELAGVASAPSTGRVSLETANLGEQYAIPNQQVTVKALPMLKGYFKVSYLRAPSAPQALFASEQVIDELAHAAGMDPVEFRRLNTNPKDDRWLGVLNAATAAAKWQPRVANSEAQTGNIRTGRGVALGGYAETAAGVVTDIEVNMKTGKIRVKHVYAAQDAGLTVNPALVENQIEGAVVQGVSRATIEQVTFDKKRVTSLDWASYPAIRFKDSPGVTPIVVQRLDRASTGSGEPTLAPTPAAIANAFFDATGVRLRHAPMTPGVVRAFLEAAKA